MKNITPGEALRRYRDNELEIRRIEEELTVWRSRAQRVTRAFSATAGRGGSGDDAVQHAVDQMDALQTQLLQKLEAAVYLRRQAEKLLAAVEDDRTRLLLGLRYIQGYTFENIAEELDITYQWTFELHKRAARKYLPPAA